MHNINIVKDMLKAGVYNEQLQNIYNCTDSETEFYAKRYIRVIDNFESMFGKKESIALFSAPGRTEIGGNHTDHQHGCVIAGSVNLDVIAAAAPNGTNVVRIKSEGYPMDIIKLDELEIKEDEFETAAALIRGIIKKFVDLGYSVGGFDAYTVSNVLKGSGLSSSAAFEVLVGTVINGLFANGEVDATEIAKFGKFAENIYYNKPSGLMDQMASSVGSMVFIDFKSTEKPVVEKLEFDLKKHGHALCIIDSGADHADLTDEYASIPAEMKEIASYFGKKYLREIDRNEFYDNIHNIRLKINNDRAILRAIHFFDENDRAISEMQAIKNDDFEEFKRLVRESGYSSYMYLQNIFSNNMPKKQAVSLVLALCSEILGDRGAYRVHGGGFAGTVQAFVPFDMLDDFKRRIEDVVGKDSCHILSIRPVGGCELK